MELRLSALKKFESSELMDADDELTIKECKQINYHFGVKRNPL